MAAGATRKNPYAFLPSLARTGRGGTVQRVQDAIRDAIVHLHLPPGTPLDKAALCARLGVSRFPVSEALGRLAADKFPPEHEARSRERTGDRPPNPEMVQEIAR